MKYLFKITAIAILFSIPTNSRASLEDEVGDIEIIQHYRIKNGDNINFLPMSQHNAIDPTTEVMNLPYSVFAEMRIETQCGLGAFSIPDAGKGFRKAGMLFGDEISLDSHGTIFINETVSPPASAHIVKYNVVGHPEGHTAYYRFIGTVSGVSNDGLLQDDINAAISAALANQPEEEIDDSDNGSDGGQEGSVDNGDSQDEQDDSEELVDNGNGKGDNSGDSYAGGGDTDNNNNGNNNGGNGSGSDSGQFTEGQFVNGAYRYSSREAAIKGMKNKAFGMTKDIITNKKSSSLYNANNVLDKRSSNAAMKDIQKMLNDKVMNSPDLQKLRMMNRQRVR